jgi:hydroxycarboxylate dehydrogenase B
MIASDGTARVTVAPLRAFVAKIFRAIGSAETEATIVGDHLIDANLVGHDSHGVIRVPKYVDWCARGMVRANRHASIAVDSLSHAVVDGDMGYGQVIGHEAMTIASGKARAHGVAVVAIRNTGHLGRIGAWAEQVAHAGLASVHFVNTSGFGLLVAPYRGSDRRLSANPIAAGAPGPDGAPLVLDISTATIAEGKIQVAKNRGEALPEGATIDARGRPNRDPAAFYGPPQGALLPFGGHKGYGLSVFCEILAGALTGGQTTHPDHATAAHLSNNMLSVVFDPAAFCGEESFRDEIARFAAWVKASPPADRGEAVELPGEPERRTRREREREGIPLDATTCRQLADCAGALGVPVPAELRR